MEVTSLLVDSVMARSIPRHWYMVGWRRRGTIPRSHFACGRPGGSLWVFKLWAEPVA